MENECEDAGVERVARAIYKVEAEEDGWTWEKDVQANRDSCLTKAKAAIAAMNGGK